MANENIVTNIVATADFSGLISDINKATASLAKLQEQLNTSNKTLAVQAAKISQTFSETLRSTGQFSTHFVSLSSDVDKFGKNLDGGKLKLKQYFQTFQEHTKTSGGLIRELAKQQVALQNAILQPLGRNAQGLMQFNVQVPRGLDEIRNKTAIAKQELQILNKVIQDGGVQLINWGKNTQWAGRQLTVGLTVPLAAFGKAAADAFAQADAELVRLTKVYGGLAQTSTAELQKVRNQVAATAKDIASSYGVSFKDTISLAADIAATGKQGNDLLASVRETSRLAVLGEVDRQDAMKATLAIQNAFKQNTEQLTESINFLNAVENQTSTTLADLIEAIPKAGPVIKGMGGSVKDLALYLTAMKEGGVNAAEGANALKSALASLINPTKVATNMFAGFGIDLKGIVSKNAGNLTGTILELQAALDKLDPLQKQQALEQLFGKFQFARMNALFANLGKQGSQTLQVLDLMKASSADLAAVASRELSQVTESASGKYRRAIEGLKADLAGIGEQFLKVETFFINMVDGIVKFVNKLPDPIQKILTFIGGLTAVSGPLIMLTGVMANFFGYIIKGAAHFKALFRGGEGWKLLTPEILAAEKAGSLMEKTMYSDAKAASILEFALKGLNNELAILEAKASGNAISVQPTISTVAGTYITGGGGRVVNPQHPLLSPEDTRSMSHLNPVGGMTTAQRQQQTLFGVVPGAPKVNQKISNNPQMYMSGDLPKIQGASSINGVSTGVVAEEAAKWHAMTGAIAMQSESELTRLKAEVGATGLITAELSASYDALLPEMQKITALAAEKSAVIVAELQSGKIVADQAKAKIIALNAEIEGMMGTAATAIATSQGRSINLTKVPLLDQPIVDASGKSNLKELTRPGRTRDILNKIARNLGVKTYGAGYSTETTIPRRFQDGVVSMDMPVQKFAGGYTSIKAAMGAAKMLRKFAERSRMIGGLRVPNLRPGSTSGPSTISAAEEGVGLSFGQLYKTNSKIYTDPEFIAYGISPTQKGEVLTHAITPGFAKRTEGLQMAGSSPMIPASELESFGISSTTKKPYGLALPSQFIKNAQLFNDNLKTGTATAQMFRKVTGDDMMSLLLFLKDQGIPAYKARVIAERAANVLNQKIAAHRGPIDEKTFGKFVNNASVRALSSGFRPSMVARIDPFGYDAHSRNRGYDPAEYAGGVTQLPGYGGGDIVPALLEPGESVVTKHATAGNQGALTLMNAGYNLDNVLGLQEGAVGVRGAFSSAFNARREQGFIGAGLAKSGMSAMGGMGLGMGMQMAGGMMGGTAGTIMQVASILPMLSPNILGRAVNGVKILGGSLTNTTKLAGLAGRAMGLAFASGPILGATAAIGGAIFAFKKWREHVDNARKVQEATFGLTRKEAQEAGVSYNNLSDSIKNAKSQMDAMRAKGLAQYNATTPGGAPGLGLTIEGLMKAKENAKNNMPDLVNAFNKTQDNNQVMQMAQNLKAQFIAGGKSANEAAQMIYGLVSASNKADQALKVLGDGGFKSIVDKGSATDFMLKSLSKNLDNVAGVEGSAFVGQIDTVIGALDSSVKSLVGTKDSTGHIITETEAIATQYDKIAKAGLKNKQLTADGLAKLKEQRPELAAILSSSDTIGGVYAKWRLYLSGVQTDLSKITSAQAEALATFTQALDTAAEASKTNTSSDNLLSSAAKVTKKLQSDIVAANAAAKKLSSNVIGLTKQEIKAINDKIKAINSEAEAKKKALQAQQDSANAAIEIQKAQLDYQNAVASGNRDAAAQAQLRIEQLTKQQQTTAALAKIEDNRQKAVDKEQAKLDADQAKKDAASQTGVSLGKTADTKQGTLDTITSLENTLTTIAKNKNIAAGMKEGKEKDQYVKEMITGPFQAFLQDLGKAAKSSPEVRKAFADYLQKDAKGNVTSTPLAGNAAGTTTSPTGGTYNVSAGGAMDSLNALSKQYGNYAKDIIGKGGKTLSDIYNALNGIKAPESKSLTTADVKSLVKENQGTDSAYYKNPFDKNKDLEMGVREMIVAKYKLKAGDTFTVDGVQYNVKNGYDANIRPGYTVKKAGGGRVVPGIMYSINDGMKTEGIKFDRPGTVYPNIATAEPRFNVPSSNILGMSGGTNSSYNNNSYVINIELNGTNITPDDIMRKFKQEMALINAKEGRSRTVGGRG